MAQAMRFAPLALTVLCAALLSGCSVSQGADGQAASAPGNLAYQGAATGSHSSKFDCDGSGTVSVGAQLGSGSVTIKVLDGNGATVYSKEFSGAGQGADSKSVQGAAGTWTLSAVRESGGAMAGGGWSGQYGVDAKC